MANILILGAGAMGSAFAFPCVDNGNTVSIVGTHLEDKFIDTIKQQNNLHPYLNCELPTNIKLFKFKNFKEAINNNINLIVLAVNSKGIEWAAKNLGKSIKNEIPILLLTKGLCLINNKYKTLADKLNTLLLKNGQKKTNITAVGGPCLAGGLANRIRSSIVLANSDLKIAKKISDIITTDYYSTEISDDLIGVEVCAAIKNIYSMIIGASEGLSSEKAAKEVKNKNFLNTAASLMHQSISEMVLFTKSLGGRESTVYGLAGLGDLYVSSAGGRNSKMGKYLGYGMSYKDAKNTYMPKDTIEGAELAFEIGSQILNDYKRSQLPLMMSIIDAICSNKKLKLNWIDKGLKD
tara:strand:+ start:50 stop:1099 length:1050 start_codon:yes stop_codon:yes gene_type:complete